jgi:hypothetical protein
MRKLTNIRHNNKITQLILEIQITVVLFYINNHYENNKGETFSPFILNVVFHYILFSFTSFGVCMCVCVCVCVYSFS